MGTHLNMLHITESLKSHLFNILLGSRCAYCWYWTQYPTHGSNKLFFPARSLARCFFPEINEISQYSTHSYVTVVGLSLLFKVRIGASILEHLLVKTALLVFCTCCYAWFNELFDWLLIYILTNQGRSFYSTVCNKNF